MCNELVLSVSRLSRRLITYYSECKLHTVIISVSRPASIDEMMSIMYTVHGTVFVRNKIANKNVRSECFVRCLYAVETSLHLQISVVVNSVVILIFRPCNMRLSQDRVNMRFYATLSRRGNLDIW